MNLSRSFFLICCALFSLGSQASETKGRFTLGAYAATERFTSDEGGSDKNDSAVISSRAYLKITGIEDTSWDFTTDLRDKNDFFDKLDREKLQLDERNSFQVRELNVKYNNDNAIFSTTLGRFPFQEAGAVGVDGALAELRHTRTWSTGVFGGLNPKRNDQTYYQYNPTSTLYGIANTYQSRGGGWDKNLYLSHALVTENEGSDTDRSYFFHNGIYQWEKDCRIISLMYLDFVPTTYVQNGNLIWQQAYDPQFSSQLSALVIDVIAYSRRQGIRETLAPSPYREASGKVNYKTTPLQKYEIGVSHGAREIDQLTRTELYLGLEQNMFWDRHSDGFVRLGARKNFVSDDVFSHFYLGYFTRKIEFGFDGEYAIEKYKDSITKHVTTVELSSSLYVSKALFLTASVERAADESVEIWAGSFKLAYRFGGGEIPPIRDGSSPRGQL